MTSTKREMYYPFCVLCQEDAADPADLLPVIAGQAGRALVAADGFDAAAMESFLDAGAWLLIERADIQGRANAREELEALIAKGKEKVMVKDYAFAGSLDLLKLGASLVCDGDESPKKTPGQVKLLRDAAQGKAGVRVLPAGYRPADLAAHARNGMRLFFAKSEHHEPDFEPLKALIETAGSKVVICGSHYGNDRLKTFYRLGATILFCGHDAVPDLNSIQLLANLGAFERGSAEHILVRPDLKLEDDFLEIKSLADAGKLTLLTDNQFLLDR